MPRCIGSASVPIQTVPTDAIIRARAPEAVKRLRPFLVALQFLTRLPIHLPETPDECEIGQSLLYYPLVGLLLGLILAALAWAIWDSSSMLHAALLAAWVLMTGALHLDGFADSADAWVGGQGSCERTLAIMKDPYCGPAGAVALILLLGTVRKLPLQLCAQLARLLIDSTA